MTEPENTEDPTIVLQNNIEQEARARGFPVELDIRINSHGTFVLNYSNTPEPAQHYTIRTAGNSVFGPRDRRWHPDEIPLAVECAQLQMEGIDHLSDEFRSQPAGWSDTEGRFVTMGERLDRHAQAQTSHGDFKKREKALFDEAGFSGSSSKLLEQDPERARELAIARISRQPTYTMFDGTTYPSEEIVEAIRSQTPRGEQAVKREFIILWAYERLLMNNRML